MFIGNITMDKQIRRKINKISGKEITEEITKIMGHMQCPKDFKYANSGFEVLCHAKNCGMDHYLECLEDDPLSCKFVIIFGEQYYCKCPLSAEPVFRLAGIKKRDYSGIKLPSGEKQKGLAG